MNGPARKALAFNKRLLPIIQELLAYELSNTEIVTHLNEHIILSYHGRIWDPSSLKYFLKNNNLSRDYSRLRRKWVFRDDGLTVKGEEI